MPGEEERDNDQAAKTMEDQQQATENASSQELQEKDANPYIIDAEPEEIIPISPEEDALQAQETLRDMIVGIAACTIVTAAAGSLLAGVFGIVWYKMLAGVLLGGAVAELMLWHMYTSIDRVLDMDADSAVKYTKRSASKRMLMAAAALAVSALLPKLFSVFGVLIGVLSLKFSAYLQPLTHKVIKSINKGR